MSLSDERRDQINEAIFAGRKVEAIKLYREATGKGLMESKEFIEKLTESLRKEYPDRVPESSAGCSSLILFAATVGTAIWWCVA